MLFKRMVMNSAGDSSVMNAKGGRKGERMMMRRKEE